jgi:tripeptidyl-peptidase-1
VEISHPDSKNYAKHLSQEEVHSMFAPAEESAEIVKNWLLGSGLFSKNDIIEYENKG